MSNKTLYLSLSGVAREDRQLGQVGNLCSNLQIFGQEKFKICRKQGWIPTEIWEILFYTENLKHA